MSDVITTGTRIRWAIAGALQVPGMLINEVISILMNDENTEETIREKAKCSTRAYIIATALIVLNQLNKTPNPEAFIATTIFFGGLILLIKTIYNNSKIKKLMINQVLKKQLG